MLQLLGNLFIILIMLGNNLAYAGSFYTDCVAGNDFGNDAVEQIFLTPLNPNCQSICQTECNSFSRKMNGTELNQPIITACQTACQNGVYYSSSFYDVADATKLPPTLAIQPSVTTQVKCTPRDWALNNIYQTSFKVKQGDKVRLSLSGSKGNNKVYLCGKQDITLLPIFSSPNSSDWDNNTSQTQWTNSSQHICLYYMTASEWNNLTNQKLWSLGYFPLSQNYPDVCLSGQSVYSATNTPVSTSILYNAVKQKNNNVQQQTNDTNLNNTINDLNDYVNDHKDSQYTPSQSSQIPLPPQGSLPATTSLCANSIKSPLADPYGPCKWSARNYNYTKTGIYIADGDELSISWTGIYSHNQPEVRGMNTNDLAKCMTDPNNSASVRNTCYNNFVLDSSIQMMPANQSNFNISAVAPIVLTGEKARLSPIGTHSPIQNYSSSSTSSNAAKILGLQGSVIDNNLQINILQNCTLNSTQSANNPALQSCLATATTPEAIQSCNQQAAMQGNVQNTSDPSCIQILDLGTPQYIYTGVLSGFSTQRSPLGLRHYDNTISTGAYEDNFGGYDVSISWGGCPRYNGENVQYVVAGSASAITESMWTDLPKDVFNSGNYLVIDSKQPGTLFFRIKTITPPAGSSSDIINLYTSPGSYFGQYYITAQLLKENGNVQCGNICSFVSYIHEVLLGKSDTPGAAQVVFNGVVANSQYVSIVRALLVLYIAFFGAGFLIGTIKLNQQEALIRIMKVAVILALISPTSWDFFGTYLLNMFINGGIDLIALVVSGSFTTDIVDVSKDPFAVFSLFDGPISQMFSGAVWKKIYALVCTGLLGIVIAIVIIYCIFMYVLSLLKATLVYIYSLVGIAILITIAPIFLCCMLFELTKGLFESWWKYLVSYTLQPVMVFSSIAIFSLVLMALLYTCLNFTACEFCLVGVDLGALYNECWIPGYHTTLAMNIPTANVPNFYLPNVGAVNIISTALAFLLVGSSMYKFTSFIAGLCSKLITGQFDRSSSAAEPADTTVTVMKNTAQTTITNAAQISSLGIKGVGEIGGKVAPGISQGANKLGGGIEQAGQTGAGMLNKLVD